jgi:hypothetical protein
MREGFGSVDSKELRRNTIRMQSWPFAGLFISLEQKAWEHRPPPSYEEFAPKRKGGR